MTLGPGALASVAVFERDVIRARRGALEPAQEHATDIALGVVIAKGFGGARVRAHVFARWSRYWFRLVNLVAARFRADAASQKTTSTL